MNKIIDINDNIHWSPREENSFLSDHRDINTFIIINETNKQIDFNKCNYLDDINMYDTIFTASIINEYINTDSNLLCVYGTIGYSADTQDADFIYDKKNNKIYIISRYRMITDNNELELYKDYFEMSYDKYWKLDTTVKTELKEIPIETKYEKIGDNSIPYYRYPRTKDGISIPRVIFSVFKIFSNENIPNELKPKIIIPNNTEGY
jgi:hypothetical protein